MALCRSMNHKKNYHSVKKGRFFGNFKEKVGNLEK